MNYINLNYLIWLPLVTLSVTLVAFFFQTLATRRRIWKKCRDTDEVVKRILRNIEKLAESNYGRYTIRDVRQRLVARVESADPVVQLLVDSPGASLDAQILRIEGLVQQSYGGDLSNSIYTVGNLAVLVALALTSMKILTALIQMGSADPARISTVIGQGLMSTVAGATLASCAVLLDWLLLDGPVDQITRVLIRSTCVIADACSINIPGNGDRLAPAPHTAEPGPMESAESGRALARQAQRVVRPPLPPCAQSDHFASGNGNHPYAPH